MSTLFDDVIKSINRVFERIETETPKESKEEIAKKAKQLVDEAIGNAKSKKPEEKIIHLHSYKVPENELRTGLIQKNGIIFSCSARNMRMRFTRWQVSSSSIRKD